MTLGQKELSKAEVVSIVTGQLIDELILRSHRDNIYRNYYDVAILGYSQDRVYPLLGEEVAFYPITRFAGRNVRRAQYSFIHKTFGQGERLLCDEVSMWIDPRAEGSTPMYKMINRVTQLVEAWCQEEENRDSFPPLVFNITDGEASDADYDMLRNAAARLKNTGTRDGKTLFVNVHISSNTLHTPILFPNLNEVPLGIRHAHLLMDISSVMPKELENYISECRSNFAPSPYVAMSYNASVSELVALLNIGTRSLVMGV